MPEHHCRRLALTLCCLFATLGSPALSSDADDDVTLRFVTIDVAPWAATDPDTGETWGAFVALIEKLREKTGLGIEITLTPFARVERELETGNHDCTVLIPRDTDTVVRGEAVFAHPIGVIPRHNVTLNEYEDLHELSISLLRGSTVAPRFDADETLRLEYDTDYTIALRKLSRARVDAVAGAIPTMLYLARQEGLANHLGEPLVLQEVPLRFQCSHRSAHLDQMPKINRAIRTLRADGTLDKIMADYHF